MELLDLGVGLSVCGGLIGDLDPDLIARVVLDLLVAILLCLLELGGSNGKCRVVAGMPPEVDGESGDDGRREGAPDPIRKFGLDEGDDSSEDSAGDRREKNERRNGPHDAERR